MKTIFYLFSILFCIPCCLYGQDDDNTHVTVHVGEQRLSDLLTDEQRSSVTHLTVTGTLEKDDYAFLRSYVLGHLDELNLRDTDIDTIPEGALIEMKDFSRIILPFNIKHIEDDAVAFEYWNGKIEVPGRFPTRGELDYPYFTISDNNPYCEKYTEDGRVDIYSANGDTLFYLSTMFEYRDEIRVKAGTKVINSTALRNVEFFPQMNLVLPNSLDSIGDYALNIRSLAITGVNKRDYPNGNQGSYYAGSLFCEAPIPPKLGRNVFNIDIVNWNLYVPESSLDLYRNTEGWNSFANIRSIEWLLQNESSVRNVRCSYTETSCVLTFSRPVRCLYIYNLQGMLLKSIDVNSTCATIDKTLLSLPYALVRVQYGNGDVETLKLKP